MMDIIIFSKDRAMQLDLLLRSIRKYVKLPYKIMVLMKSSSEEFKLGYKILYREINEASPIGNVINLSQPNVRNLLKDEYLVFVDEKKFKEDLLNYINNYVKNPYIMFLTDDDVFINYMIKDEAFDMFALQHSVCCLSNRLHPKINWWYGQQKEVSIPLLDEGNVWDYTKADKLWSSWYSLDGNLFKTYDIVRLLNVLNFKSPNTLESAMKNSKGIHDHHLNVKPLMVCRNKACLIGLPLNQVQTDWKLKSGDKYNAKYLNDEWLSGKQISMGNLKGLDVNSYHYEEDIELEKRNA